MKKYGFARMLDNVFESSDEKLFEKSADGTEYCNNSSKRVSSIQRYLRDKLKDLNEESKKIFKEYLSNKGYELKESELHHFINGHDRVMRIAG